MPLTPELLLYLPPLTMNPATGDGNNVLLPVMVGLLVVSAILVVILAITGKNKKGRK